MKSVEIWISANGFTNYPDPQYAPDYDRHTDPLYSDCPEILVPNGQTVPFERGEIMLTDLKGGRHLLL